MKEARFISLDLKYAISLIELSEQVSSHYEINIMFVSKLEHIGSILVSMFSRHAQNCNSEQFSRFVEVFCFLEEIRFVTKGSVTDQNQVAEK